jgi:putative ABC transport system permease protein
MDTRVVDHASRDARYGLRLLQRSPIFSVVAILSLALGIGANAAIFHVIDAIQLRTLAVARPHELAEVRPDGPQAFGTYDGVNAKATAPLWELIRTNQRAFSTMFAWGDAELVVGRGAESRLARGLWVSGGFFGALGITPARGRLFRPDDDRAGCGATAVISHGFWQSSFGGRESAVGSALTVLDRPVTVIGVAPSSFTGLEVGETFDIALPLCSTALWDERLHQRDRWWLTIMGRLKPEWTHIGANEHLRALSPGVLDATIPPGYDASLVDGYRRLRFGVVPAGRGVSRLRDAHASSLTLLLGLTSLVLLMTCGNLATLMLARASAREREIAVRAAIGASRGRLVSQILIESLLVATAGAVLALPVAFVSARALVALLGASAGPIALQLAVNWRLIVFIGATATLTAILFGLLPGLRVSLVDPNTVMRLGARGTPIDRHRARLQRGLVVAQIALSLVLVFSALLLVQTFRNLASVPTGFEAEGTLVFAFMDRASDALSAERKAAFQDQLTREIRAVPGVVAAVSSTHVPLSGATWAHFFRVTGGTGERKASRFAYVSPGYFDALRIPIRSGRDFQDLDNARSRRVMVVNESFVRSHLDGVEPIGAAVRTLEEPGFPEIVYEIIGIVGDTKYADLRVENCWCQNAGESMAPIAYVPIAQNPSPYAWAPVIVRSRTPDVAIAGTIAQRVERLAPGIALHVSQLKARVGERLRNERMVAWLAGVFAVLATVLVVVGLYGIVAYLVTSRRSEIAIRLALGSTRGQIVALVLRENLWMLAAGIVVGLPLAVGAMRAARALLYGLSPTDGGMVAGATCLIVVAGGLAAMIPAWHAARLHLADAIRPE